MSADLAKFRTIVAEAESLDEDGELTREKFQELYRAGVAALGTGVEAEAIEAIVMLAPDPSWLPSE